MPKYIEETVLAAYARLKPGMTIDQLNAAMPALGQRLNLELPQREELSHLHATPVSGFARIQKER